MAQHDVDRFERLILPHLDAAYTLARYLLRDEHDAQDVVQDAALRALRHFGGFRGSGESDARAWLLSIVRNCAMSHAASRRRDAENTDVHESIAGDERADARAIAASESERVMRAVASLPVEFREVIVLREVEEMSYKEIGAVVGAPIGTVMSRLARARKRLAELLGDSALEVG
jgi:RNA polymerase sigma factor (sigma-70 family)